MNEREAAKKQKMSYNEHLLNKQLLREINEKRKDPSQGMMSQVGH
jgi:hypothetical protein